MRIIVSIVSIYLFLLFKYFFNSIVAFLELLNKVFAEIKLKEFIPLVFFY